MFPCFPVLRFPPLQIWSRVFQSCIFHPCDLVPRFPVLRFPVPHFQSPHRHTHTLITSDILVQILFMALLCIWGNMFSRCTSVSASVRASVRHISTISYKTNNGISLMMQFRVHQNSLHFKGQGSRSRSQWDQIFEWVIAVGGCFNVFLF